MKANSSGYASGKIILSGEHAVVYGARAIVASIPEAVKATITKRTPKTHLLIPSWDIDLEFDLTQSQESLYGQTLSLIVNQLNVQETPFEIHVEASIPYAMGLGGSAAVSVAIIKAINSAFDIGLDQEAINQLAFECEKITHGTPSGVDNYVATYGTLVCYRKLGGVSQTISHINKDFPLSMLIAFTGKRGYTAQTVQRVAQARERNLSYYDQVFNKIDRISGKIQNALSFKKIDEIGALMNENQKLLRDIKVSCTEIDDIVETSLEAGALGAKLTGGGDGGAVIVLCPHTQNNVKSNLVSKGYEIKEIVL